MANATGFGGLAKNMSLPADMCIIGNECLKGMTVAFDMDKAQLGLGGMCINDDKNKPAAVCYKWVKPEVEQ